jgi:hypothetical protein
MRLCNATTCICVKASTFLPGRTRALSSAQGGPGFPDLPLNKEWADAELYKRYGLNKDEIAFIESQVAEHDADLFDEAAADEIEDE